MKHRNHFYLIPRVSAGRGPGFWLTGGTPLTWLTEERLAGAIAAEEVGGRWQLYS